MESCHTLDVEKIHFPQICSEHRSQRFTLNLRSTDLMSEKIRIRDKFSTILRITTRGSATDRNILLSTNHDPRSLDFLHSNLRVIDGNDSNQIDEKWKKMIRMITDQRPRDKVDPDRESQFLQPVIGDPIPTLPRHRSTLYPCADCNTSWWNEKNSLFRRKKAKFQSF